MLSFHSLSERPRRSKIDIWAGAIFPHFLGLGRHGRAIELEGGPRLPPRLTPFDRRFWGHGSGIPSLLRPIQNSGLSCFRFGAWRASTRVAPLALLAFIGRQRRAI